MTIEKITVLGAGTMGHGIAQTAISAGYTVVMYDVEQKFVDSGLDRIRKSFAKLIEKGRISQEDADQRLSRLTTSTVLSEAAKEADFVIEAIPELMELKKQTFAELDQICKPETILASNTSVLPVTAIAGATERKDKCIGMHFFNPVALMKLVEVVLPIGVAEETVEITLEVCKMMGKTPVTTKDLPGFIVNRLLGLLYMEAAQMVLEGEATAEEIDIAMKLGAGHPMGPCELADFGGFDVIQMGQDGKYAYTHSEGDKLNILYRKMLEAGRLGKKNGKGFYDYLPDGTKKPFKIF